MSDDINSLARQLQSIAQMGDRIIVGRAGARGADGRAIITSHDRQRSEIANAPSNWTAGEAIAVRTQTGQWQIIASSAGTVGDEKVDLLERRRPRRKRSGKAAILYAVDQGEATEIWLKITKRPAILLKSYPLQHTLAGGQLGDLSSGQGVGDDEFGSLPRSGSEDSGSNYSRTVTSTINNWGSGSGTGTVDRALSSNIVNSGRINTQIALPPGFYGRMTGEGSISATVTTESNNPVNPDPGMFCQMIDQSILSGAPKG